MLELENEETEPDGAGKTLNWAEPASLHRFKPSEIATSTMVEGHQCHRLAILHRAKLVGKAFKATSPNGRWGVILAHQPAHSLTRSLASFRFSDGARIISDRCVSDIAPARIPRPSHNDPLTHSLTLYHTHPTARCVRSR